MADNNLSQGPDLMLWWGWQSHRCQVGTIGSLCSWSRITEAQKIMTPKDKPEFAQIDENSECLHLQPLTLMMPATCPLTLVPLPRSCSAPAPSLETLLEETWQELG